MASPFPQLDLCSALGIATEALKRFVLDVRDHMQENPYHNWAHAFDVLQVSLSRSFDDLQNTSEGGIGQAHSSVCT
jgi:hypothetical protein